MQTFLPYPDAVKTAKCLDYRRLGKQRVEAMQILNTITGASIGWRNHPAVKMWVGYAPFLELYCNAMISEWIGRGYKNTMVIYRTDPQSVTPPPWLGDERVHSSHRANLIRKDPDFYGKFGWTESPITGYFWP
jgi:hypothetical protein